jgi:hypothetical protein
MINLHYEPVAKAERKNTIRMYHRGRENKINSKNQKNQKKNRENEDKASSNRKKMKTHQY